MMDALFMGRIRLYHIYLSEHDLPDLSGGKNFVGWLFIPYETEGMDYAVLMCEPMDWVVEAVKRHLLEDELSPLKVRHAGETQIKRLYVFRFPMPEEIYEVP